MHGRLKTLFKAGRTPSTPDPWALVFLGSDVQLVVNDLAAQLVGLGGVAVVQRVSPYKLQ